MNNFEYENQLGTVHLVYHIQPQDEVDTFVLGMLCNNEIQGIAKTLFTQIDSEKLVKYNVSSKISVSRFFDGPVNKKRLIGVFSGIVDAMLSVEEYMIDQRTLVLDLDYIFTDVSTNETIMICLPLESMGVDSGLDMNAFFKNIIFSTKFDQTENCDYVAQILNCLNSNPTLSLNRFKKLLDELSKPQESKETAKPTVNAGKPIQVSTSTPVLKSLDEVMPTEVKPESNLAGKQVAPQIGDGIVHTPKPAYFIQENVSDVSKFKQTSGEIPMSMLYLLRHYNKENVAAYKAQKEKKKEIKPSTVSASGIKQSREPAQAQTNHGFAVPTKKDPVTTSFEVPRQQPNMSHPVVKQVNASIAQPVVPCENKTSENQSAFKPVPATPINFGETTVLGGGQIGETTVLGAATSPARVDPYLIRNKNNEKIPLNKPIFRIGKERSYVDYFIGDNTAISRSHANIINENGEFFVVDTNSTNHTYVNGGMIRSNVQTKLFHGTKIRLANEDFEFRMY